jgi:hypothetical protein
MTAPRSRQGKTIDEPMHKIIPISTSSHTYKDVDEIQHETTFLPLPILDIPPVEQINEPFPPTPTNDLKYWPVVFKEINRNMRQPYLRRPINDKWSLEVPTNSSTIVDGHCISGLNGPRVDFESLRCALLHQGRAAFEPAYKIQEFPLGDVEIVWYSASYVDPSLLMDAVEIALDRCGGVFVGAVMTFLEQKARKISPAPLCMGLRGGEKVSGLTCKILVETFKNIWIGRNAGQLVLPTYMQGLLRYNL